MKIIWYFSEFVVNENRNKDEDTMTVVEGYVNRERSKNCLLIKRNENLIECGEYNIQE